MRLLILIPHFFRHPGAGDPAGPRGFYGSEVSGAEERAAVVTQALAALHQTFGPRQDLCGRTDPYPANTALRVEIDVALVTTGDDHLADRLPRHLFHHISAPVDPRHLGFVCHRLMRDNAGRFDWYGYMEDDIEVSDPLFLDKLSWFGATFGHSAVLQPNRYETSADLTSLKLYVDGNTTRPEMAAQFQDTGTRPRLEAEVLGRRMVFKRVDNVHAGCFFLNAAQFARVAASPRFGEASGKFFGPLETAATVPVMRHFEVYKPARENAGFLEVRHLGRRFLAPRAPPPAAET